MATSITKNYALDVTFKYVDGSDIAEGDLNVAAMRIEIAKRIKEVANVTRGNINAVPSDVTET